MTGAAERDLLDRAGEVARLEDRLSLAASGVGGVAYIEGAAGIGKTSLGQVLADSAATRGFHVLAARGAALERDLPFGIVRQLFDPALRRLDAGARDRLLEGAAALAGLALGGSGFDVPVDSTPQTVSSSRSSAFHGFYWLTANLAEEAPVLLWVDDGHWADGPSVQFLAFMSRRVADLGVLLLVGARPAEPGADEALEAIRDEPDGVVVCPGPLGDESVVSLLRTVLGAEPEASFVAACAQRTGGNPYLLRELAVDLRARQLPPNGRSVAEIDKLGHATVGRSISARLERMPPGGRSLAEALAVLETPSELRLVAAVAGTDLERSAELADRLAAVEILGPGARLAFRHPLVRAAVYAQIPPSRRAILHGRAAAALDMEAADVQRVAAQLLRSQPRADPSVVATLRRAAAEAMARATPTTAAACLARGLREPPAPDQRMDILRDLGRAEIAAGRIAGFDHLHEAMAGLASSVDRAATALELGRALAYHMRFREARKVLLEGIAIVRDIDRELWLELEAQLIFTLRSDLPVDPEFASRFEELTASLQGDTPGERAVLVALGESARIGRARTAAEAAEVAEWIVAAGLGPPDGPDPFEDEIADPGAAITTATLHGLPVLVHTDRLDVADVYVERVMRIARRRGDYFLMVFGLALRAGVARARGCVADAEADARLAMALGPDLNRPVPPVVSSLLYGLIERGRLDEAEEQLDRFDYAGDLPEIRPANMLLFDRARLRMAQARPEEAIKDLNALGRRYERWGSRRPGAPWRAELALALARVGRTEEAVELARHELAAAKEWGATPRGIAIAQRALGQVSADPDEGVELLRCSVDLLERSPRRLELAYSLFALGAALRRRRQPRDARESLERAMDMATRCGSTTLAEAAREELLRTGARPRRHALTGAEALTASERRAAEMAARGLTNKQIAQELFLSTRTIETHLSHAYQKLDIASRGELAGAFHDIRRRH